MNITSNHILYCMNHPNTNKRYLLVFYSFYILDSGLLYTSTLSIHLSRHDNYHLNLCNIHYRKYIYSMKLPYYYLLNKMYNKYHYISKFSIINCTVNINIYYFQNTHYYKCIEIPLVFDFKIHHNSCTDSIDLSRFRI